MRPHRRFAAAVVLVATVGLAAVWTLLAHRELDRARQEDVATRLDRARATFDAARGRSQDGLRAMGRLLAEDPRLKATLATGEVDGATVDDILRDLASLRGDGFFMVLSPDGRVFAEAGASQLRGLDLSASSLVQQAGRAPDAVLGSWPLAGAVMDLSVQAIRYGDALVAYLVVGQSLDDGEMQALAAQCGCAAATTLGDALASSSQGADAELLRRMAGRPGAWRGHAVSLTGTRYVTTAVELGDVAQSHRLLLASGLAPLAGSSSRLATLLWFPPALVLAALLLFMVASRPPARS